MNEEEQHLFANIANEALAAYAKKKHGLPISKEKQDKFWSGAGQSLIGLGDGVSLESLYANLQDMPRHERAMNIIPQIIGVMLEFHEQKLSSNPHVTARLIKNYAASLYSEMLSGEHAIVLDEARLTKWHEKFLQTLRDTKNPKPKARAA